MNAKEIVRALRCCSNVDTRKPDCENCPLFSTRLCVKIMLEGAADLIESLQAELDKLNDFEQGQCAKLLAQLTERDEGIKRLQRELTSLAIESLDRVRELAKLEAEVIAMRACGREGDAE
ncbi:MAG: hypothetical protein GX117_04995 [Candidatus Hydrogenedentes bacterium]|nr:hypothetical protein [Candidatus Hydrogenedentota bacterium]